MGIRTPARQDTKCQGLKRCQARYFALEPVMPINNDRLNGPLCHLRRRCFDNLSANKVEPFGKGGRGGDSGER